LLSCKSRGRVQVHCCLQPMTCIRKCLRMVRYSCCTGALFLSLSQPCDSHRCFHIISCYFVYVVYCQCFLGDRFHPMLSDHCLVLSVCLCDVGVLWPNGWMDQDATWSEVGLGPGDIVLDADPALPPKGAQPPSNFRPMSFVAKRLHGLRCHLVWR